jgi:hypothetical protein
MIRPSLISPYLSISIAWINANIGHVAMMTMSAQSKTSVK